MTATFVPISSLIKARAKIVKFDRWLHLKKNKYTTLLNVLICLFLATSFLDYWLGWLVLSLGFFGLSLVVLETLYLSKKMIFFLRAIAVIAFVLRIIDLFELSQFDVYISTVGYLGYALFMILAILVLQKRINTAKKVDNDIIKGGICIYLILGFLWTIFYLIIWRLDPSAFTGFTLDNNANRKLLYFSFTSLTTLGYGDILPVSRLAMALANLEAIFGQLYPAIAIAKLVSLYTNSYNAEAAAEQERDE
jgi:hypothetical protein